MTFHRFSFSLYFCLFFAFSINGQILFESGFRAKNPSYCDLLKRFSTLEALRGASWGICVKGLQGEKTLVQFQAGQNFIPASNQKVLTSLNGLAHLGPDFTFKTHFYLDGPIENGILKGNLWVKGGGDPVIYSPDREKFGKNFFEVLLKVFQDKGIKAIDGKIIQVPLKNPYEGIQNDWGWVDVGNYYGAGIYDLNLNENQYHLYFEARQKGKIARLKKTDSLSDLIISESKVETDDAGTPDMAYIFWLPGEGKAEVKGNLPADSGLQKVKGSIQNPSSFFLKYLEDFLKTKGVSFGKQNLEAKNGLEFLWTWESPQLRRIVKEVNLNSHNLMTEAIAFALAKPVSKRDENGWTHLETFAKELAFTPGFYFADGSGLSLSNRISPDALVKSLVWAEKQAFFPVFMESLPSSGETGTMKNYCKAAKGKIRAKSGTLTRALCYSGYAETGGKTLAFSIMINNYHGPFKAMKAELEKVLVGLTQVK